MNKKGILIGQVFAFIIAGIIFVLIIGFGYNAITDLIQSSKEISVAELKSDLAGAVDSTRRSYGSVRKIELRAPKEIQELCFFDYDNCAFDGAKSGKVSLAWAVSACKTKSANVFSVPRLVELSMEEIKVPLPGFVCVRNVNGLITVKLIGKGDSVNVEGWPFEE